MAFTALTDRVARRLPRQISDHLTLELMVLPRGLSTSVTRIRPWLVITLDLEVTQFAFRLVRLPGKLAEYWDASKEPWLAGCDCDECRERAS